MRGDAKAEVAGLCLTAIQAQRPTRGGRDPSSWGSNHAWRDRGERAKTKQQTCRYGAGCKSTRCSFSHPLSSQQQKLVVAAILGMMEPNGTHDSNAPSSGSLVVGNYGSEFGSKYPELMALIRQSGYGSFTNFWAEHISNLSSDKESPSSSSLVPPPPLFFPRHPKQPEGFHRNDPTVFWLCKTMPKMEGGPGGSSGGSQSSGVQGQLDLWMAMCGCTSKTLTMMPLVKSQLSLQPLEISALKRVLETLFKESPFYCKNTVKVRRLVCYLNAFPEICTVGNMMVGEGWDAQSAIGVQLTPSTSPSPNLSGEGSQATPKWWSSGLMDVDDNYDDSKNKQYYASQVEVDSMYGAYVEEDANDVDVDSIYGDPIEVNSVYGINAPMQTTEKVITLGYESGRNINAPIQATKQLITLEDKSGWNQESGYTQNEWVALKEFVKKHKLNKIEDALFEEGITVDFLLSQPSDSIVEIVKELTDSVIQQKKIMHATQMERDTLFKT